MHIAIDVREALRPRRTGKGVWTARFVDALLREHREDLAVTLIADAPMSGEWASAAHVVLPAGPLWHVRAIRALRTHPADCYLAPTSFIVPAFLPRGRSAIVVHDLIAFHGDPHDRKATMLERLLLGRSARRARWVFTVSDATRAEFLERFPCVAPVRVRTVGAGPFTGNPEPARCDGGYVLCAGTLCPRKNQLRLVQAYRLLPEDLRRRFRLLLAGGRGWDDDSILALARATEGVEWTGYVTDSAYTDLLNHCTAFVYPSLWEGFGFPVLDALQRGIPVLTSDRGSLREVAGYAAVYADPEDPASIAAGLERLLTHDALRERLRDAGPPRAERFSWKRTADAFLDAILELC